MVLDHQHLLVSLEGPEKIHGGRVDPDYPRMDNISGDVDPVPTSVLLGTIYRYNFGPFFIFYLKH